MKIIMLRSNPVEPYPRLEKSAESLAKNGHSVRVAAWDRKNKYKEKLDVLNFKSMSVPIIRFGIPSKYGGGFKQNFFPLLKFQFKMLKFLIKNKSTYDIIHAYDLDTGFVALLCCKLFGKKIVYDIPDYYVDSHGLKNTIIGDIVEKTEHMVINNSDAVIICTEKRINQINGSKPKILEIIHNSPSHRSFDKESEVSFKIKPSNKIKIVYVGILDNTRLLKEVAEVIKEIEECELHIAGFGQLEKYFNDIGNENNNIHFYGRISYSDALYLEKQCDIITAIYDPGIPNHYYAAPNKFYEALMLGKPLIMANNTGMDNIVTEHNIGEVIEFSKEGFRIGLIKLIDRRNEWENISIRSRELYNNYFSSKKMEVRLLELYSKL